MLTQRIYSLPELQPPPCESYSSSLCAALVVPCREALGRPLSLSLMPDLGGCGVPTLDMGRVEAPSAVEDASSKSCHSGWLAVSSRSLERRASCDGC